MTLGQWTHPHPTTPLRPTVLHTYNSFTWLANRHLTFPCPNLNIQTSSSHLLQSENGSAFHPAGKPTTCGAFLVPFPLQPPLTHQQALLAVPSRMPWSPTTSPGWFIFILLLDEQALAASYFCFHYSLAFNSSPGDRSESVPVQPPVLRGLSTLLPTKQIRTWPGHIPIIPLAHITLALRVLWMFLQHSSLGTFPSSSFSVSGSFSLCFSVTSSGRWETLPGNQHTMPCLLIPLCLPRWTTSFVFLVSHSSIYILLTGRKLVCYPPPQPWCPAVLGYRSSDIGWLNGNFLVSLLKLNSLAQPPEIDSTNWGCYSESVFRTVPGTWSTCSTCVSVQW